MTRRPPLSALALAACAPWLAGCWAVPVAGAGYLVGRELDAAAAEARAEYGLDVELVWHAARETLLELGAPRVSEFERPRRCVGELDDGVVEFEVVRLGLNRTQVTVRAVGTFGLGRPELSEHAAERLSARLADLDRSGSP